MHLFSRYRILNQQNIPKQQPFLITMNHLAYWDVPALGGVFTPPIPGFAAKKYEGSSMGIFFNLGSPIWIEQESPDRHALMIALKILQAGFMFALAPEGTRSKTGTLAKGLEGAAFLATRAQVPILPVGTWGTEKMFHQVRPNVTVSVGKPYRLPEGRAKGDQLAEYTERMMCAIAALLPESYRGYYAGNPLIEEMAKIIR